jgi:formylglycine-generating enzyme required for sulfatase activity
MISRSFLICFLIILGAPAIGSAEGFTNSLGMEFVLVRHGSFFMGSDRGHDQGASADEIPRHKVTLTQDFFLASREVTQAQWERVMGLNPSLHRGDLRPVELITWEDAQAFVKRLNGMENTNRYRLPTEAEWEYAARAGTETLYYFGDDKGGLDAQAWHMGNSGGRTHDVGTRAPNPLGLFDMLGNVWEYASDWYDVYRDFGQVTDPKGPEVGLFRVIRGGSYEDGAQRLRSANRFFKGADSASDYVGLRLACSQEAELPAR